MMPKHQIPVRVGHLRRELKTIMIAAERAHRRGLPVDPTLIARMAEIKKDIRRIESGDFKAPLEGEERNT